MFILTTYADQGRWLSAFEPLLYPTGFGFYRSFAYVPRYFVPPQLGEQLADVAQSSSLLSQPTWNDGFFGLRFKDPGAPTYLPQFIPLRRVSLTAVEAGESISLYFRLGNYVVPELLDGKPRFQALDVTQLVGDVAATKLFIHLSDAERTVANTWRLSESFPKGFWDAVEASLSPSARAKVNGSVLLRLTRVSARGSDKQLKIEEVDETRHIRGCRLQATKVYDLHLNYYRLMRTGEDYSQNPQKFCVMNTHDELQASSRIIPIIGNYRAEDMWVSPLEPTNGPIQIAVEPCSKGDTLAAADPAEARMIGLRIPVSVKPHSWPATRKTNLALVVVAFVFAYYFYREYGAAADPMQKLLLIGITTSLSVAVTALKDFLLVKR